VTAVRIAIVCVVLVLEALPGAAIPPHFKITIENGSPYFSPPVATVTTGTPIRWDNPTPTEHTITHDGCISDGPCAFDSGMMLPSEHYTLPGLPPGHYPYHCRIHPIMRGTVTITDSSTTPQI
jgi:plastocyanin